MNNRLVSFQVKNMEKNREEQKDEDNNEIDKSELLYDFGENLKSRTVAGGSQAPTPKGGFGNGTLHR